MKQMRQLEWLDFATATISVSSLVYTEGIEVFTTVTIVFSVDEAGNIDANPIVISYRDLINEAQDVFIIFLVVCIIGAFLSSAWSIYQMLKHPERCQRGSDLFELFSHLLLFCYPLALIISWSMQTP